MTHPYETDLNGKTYIFKTHVFALAVSICAFLERAGIPALFCEGKQFDGKYEVNVPAQFASEAQQVLIGWLPV
jgi:hypothetical protein